MSDIRSWVERHLKVSGWNGSEAAICCPFHDDQNPSASINIDKAAWYCHTCNRGGRLSDMAKEAGLPAPPLNGRGKIGLGIEVCRYDYRNAEGKLRYQNVRFEPKSFRPFDPDVPHDAPEKEKWSHGGKERIPYRLHKLLQAIENNYVIWIAEGERDVESLFKLGQVATCNDGGWSAGIRYWPGFVKKYFKPRLRIILCPDADEPGMKLMRHLGRVFLAAGCHVKLLNFGFPIRKEHGEDVSDWLKTHSKEELTELVRVTPRLKNEDLTELHDADTGSEEQEKKRKKQADIAIEIAGGCSFFHDDDVTYVRLKIREHFENWKVRSKEFKTWLRRQYYLKEESSIGSQALEDALGVLEGKGLFEGPDIPTFVRIAGDDQTIYLDLGNDAWQVVVINSEGWKVLADVPVRFRRPPGMKALPIPQSGGRLEIHLECFLNMDADDRKLFIACLINAFRPTGPYPVLCLHGEQGSAKSTAARIFRACIDPNTAMLRSTPREERDLLIAGTNGWVVAFDNLSHLPTWVSDALCRIATGSGFGIRQLYADDAEILFQVQRPIALNGIEDLASRGDLLDRSVLVYLPAIPEERRLTERNFLAQFEEALPLILGSLLEAVSAAIRNLGDINLPSIPRMADFCEWICAAEPALGWEAGTFLNIYRRNRADANALALEATPIVPALTKLLDNTAGEWQGTATELHEALSALVSEKTQKSKAWPRSGRSTSASLKRLAPNLRQVGIWAEWDRTNQVRTIRLKLKSIVTAVFASPSSRKTGQAGDASDANDAKTQVFDLGLNAYDDTP